MSQPSLIRSIPVPAERDNYTNAYYTLLEQFDRDVIQYGTSADRPTSPPDGYTFYDLENNKLERWDSDAGDWIVLAGFGSESNPINKTLYVNSVEYDTSSVNTLEATTVNAGTGNFTTLTASDSLTVNGKDVDAFTDTLRTDVNQNASDISAIQGSSGSDASSISELETDISNLQTDVSNLQSTTSTNASDISSLQSTTSTNSSDISTLQTDVSNLQSNKADVTGDDISANSLDAGTLEARNTLIVPNSF